MRDELTILLVGGSTEDGHRVRDILVSAYPDHALIRVSQRDQVVLRLSQEPDLVLCDYYAMDGFDGVDVLAMWLAAGATAPVIVLMDPVDGDVALECMRLGASDVIDKTEPGRLLTTVERVLKEAVLRREIAFVQRRYQDLIEHIPAVVYLAEPGAEGRWTYCSPRIESLLGYRVEEWLAQDDLWVRSIHPADRSWVIANEVTQARRRGGLPPVEYRMLRADGRIIWVRDEATVVPVSGSRVLLQGLLSDVTARKRSEQRERLAHVLNRVLSGVGSLEEAGPDLMGALCDVLHADLAGLWRRSEDDEAFTLVHMTIKPGLEAFHRASQTAVDAQASILGQVAATGETLWIEDATRALSPRRREAAGAAGLGAGVILPVRVRDEVAAVIELYTTVPEPRDDSFLVVAEVAAARIAALLETSVAESELRASELHRASIVEAALDCIITADEEGRIVEFNAAAERTFGYRRDEVRGRSIAEMLVPPYLRERHRHGFSRFVSTREGRLLGSRLELEAMRADGSIFPIEISMSSVEQGSAVFLVAHVRDIADRQAAKRELEARVRQQAAVAAFGQTALHSDASDVLMNEACDLVRDVLSVPLAVVLQVRPGGEELEVVAGAGWTEPPLGYRLPCGDRSAAGYALMTGEPVVSDEVTEDRRFRWYPAAGGPEPRSVMTVPVAGDDGWWGVLGVDSVERRHFTSDDVNFLQAIGNVLSGAVRRRDATRRIRFQAHLLEQVTAAVVVVDATGRITYWNQGATQILGWSPSQAIGSDLVDLLVKPAARAAANALFGRLVGGEAHEGEWSLLRPDGSTVPIRVSTSQLIGPDGAPEGVLGVGVDLTERKRIERELRLSESKFRTAFDSSPSGWVLVAPDGHWLEVNEALCRILGRPRSELVGAHFRDITHPDDVDTNVRDFQSMVRGERDHVEMTKRYVHPDGSVIWVELNAAAIRGAGGELEMVVTHVRDITAVRRVQAEREALEAQLAQSQKMEAIGRLAGGIAHDFNNLLSIIVNYASFVGDAVPADDPVQEDVGEIRMAAERATGLTKQLLAFSRREVVQPEPVVLNDVVVEVERLLSRTIGEDIALEVHVQDDLDPIEADRSQIEQIVMNLAVNARDAMPEGGTITIQTANVDLDPASVVTRPNLEAGPHVSLTVTDTGEGMSPDTTKLIFEPFFTTKERGKGTGLGLATVYGIVQRWGGEIEVVSEPGKGTTFCIFFPVAHEAAATNAEESPDEAPEGNGARGAILVVEDEAPVRELVARILRKHGFDVVTAGSGEEAVGLVERGAHRFDVLLTDVVMPGMSGKELVDSLQRSETAVRPVYMSGYSEDLVARSGVLAPDVRLIQKPFDAEKLVRTIEEVIAQ